MTTCERCGLPLFTGPAGYAGPQCMCRWSGAFQLPPPAYRPMPKLVVEGCQVSNPLTESDIRRIVREELERMNVVKDKSHDL